MASKPGCSRSGARTMGTSRLRTARQFSPSFGSPKDFHYFLWWLFESFGFRFWKFHSHSQLSLELRAPRTHTTQPRYCSGFTWCSNSASSPSALLSECRSAEATHQGQATALLRRLKQSECLSFLTLGTSGTPVSTITSQRAP